MNKQTIQELVRCRNQILDAALSIKDILKNDKECDREYYLAISHYIPQIVTALQKDDRWLPRGIYTLENTIDNLEDKITSPKNSGKGVTKYIV